MDVLHGGSDGGRFSMLWGMDGWEVVPTSGLTRLAFGAPSPCEQVDFVGWQVSAGTRAMLERIGTLATGGGIRGGAGREG